MPFNQNPEKGNHLQHYSCHPAYEWICEDSSYQIIDGGRFPKRQKNSCSIGPKKDCMDPRVLIAFCFPCGMQGQHSA